MSFSALDHGLQSDPFSKTSLFRESRNRLADASAIHGPSGAQVALLQSPIPQAAHKNYKIELESQR
jgi:hypothetical protein